jgi:glycosyltransferase involved in cell wall biosynthesis
VPDVAVVVTTCDYGDYLERCLQSLLDQTRQPDELVIVDDASVDNTQQVLSRMLPQIRPRFPVHVITHDTRRGFAASLNEGISATRSSLFAHVDADDVCMPRYLQALEDALTEHPRAAYAYPRLRLIGAETGLYRTLDFHPGRLLFEGNYIPNVAMVRRAAFDDTRGYRDLPTHLDWDLWVEMLGHGHHGVLVDEVLYEWRRHARAMTYQSWHVRLATRARILWRHRAVACRHLGWAIPGTTRAVARRLGLTRERRGRSGWIESHRE